MSLKNTVRGIFCGKRLSTLPAGEPAPPISLKDTNSQSFLLEEALKKGPVLAAFFKVSCPTCQFTFPFLERMYEAYGNDGFTFLGISQNNTGDTREFAQEFGVKFPLLIDDENTFTASNEYGITNVPSVFLISQDGTDSGAVGRILKTRSREHGEGSGARDKAARCSTFQARRSGSRP